MKEPKKNIVLPETDSFDSVEVSEVEYMYQGVRIAQGRDHIIIEWEAVPALIDALKEMLSNKAESGER